MPVPILDRPEERSQSPPGNILGPNQEFQSSIAPKNDRNSWPQIQILKRPGWFQSSIAPKNDRNSLKVKASSMTYLVPILDRPEERSQLPGKEFVTAPRLVPILDRPEERSQC